MNSSNEGSKQIDLESLERVTMRLREALRDFKADQSNLYILDSVIKRFELSYELATRSLRRFLIDYSINQSEIDDMSLAGIIRRGDKEGLLRTGWPAWQNFRDARNEAAHAYHEAKAREIVADAELFLPEAECLLDNLKKRLPHHD